MGRSRRELSLPCAALLVVDCLQAREAMSARMDGEPPDVSEALLQGHVERCPGCQAWREASHEVTRRVRMTGWTPADDLTPTILAAIMPRRTAGWSAPLRVVLLAIAAAGQLVLSIPQLIDGGRSVGIDMHDMHELGVFDLALAIAFVVGAIRPRLAAGLAWPCSAAAAGLAITATIDLIGHRTFELHELRHLIAVAGAILLIWTARAAGRPQPNDLSSAPVRLATRQQDQSAA
jgi:predicted anti-sigma-YlaC factor YlaD